VTVLILGYLGTEPTTVWGQFHAAEGSLLDKVLDTKDVATWVARFFTILYFGFFFLMPWYTAIDKCQPEPERVT